MGWGLLLKGEKERRGRMNDGGWGFDGDRVNENRRG